MDDFLRKIQLSEYAIEVYLKSLGKFPRSYYELYRIVPKATQEEFDKCLNELKDAGLLIPLSPKKQANVNLYSTLPPILPILNYYDNIATNLPNIKSSIRELMLDSVEKIFEENKVIELDTILKTFHDIKKDIDEDSIIQKQEVEDIVEGMEDLKKISKEISDLHQNIKSITQTKFADLIKIINSLKTDLIGNIKKKEVISLIEELFKEKFENMVVDFTNNLHEIIEKEFKDITKPINKTADVIFQYRNDFKMLLLNMLTNFETNLNKIYDLLKENNDNLSSAIMKVQNKISENLDIILQNSINEILSLNKPIEDVMKNYFQEIRTFDLKPQFNNVQIVNSVTMINEAIQNLISNSKENLTIIIPHLENHLAIEQFEGLSSNLKIKIVSSEAHTNSIVKNFNIIKTILYRSFQNENLVILNSDNSEFFIGVIQESAQPLYDFVGIRSSFQPLIDLFQPLTNNIWENAYSDTFHATQVTKSEFTKTKPTKTLTTAKPIIKTKALPEKKEKKPTKIEKKRTQPAIVPGQIKEIQKEDKRAIKTPLPKKPFSSKPQITDLKQKLKEKIEFVKVTQPNADDEAGIEINNAFTNLIQKLGNLKGDDFGRELQDIADLILEKKGFSVTLHKIRSIINKFKEKFTILDENDKREILESIENWKKKLYYII